LLLRLGAAKKEAGRAFGFVKIRVPQAGEEVRRETFTFATDKEKLRKAEQRDGHYLLRSNLTGEDPGVLWERYVQLTQIEAAFKTMKSELGLRPIYHQLGHRVEAHILVAFLAYCLLVTLKNRLHALAPGLTPRAVLETLAPMQMLDVTFPTTDGRRLVMPRYTQPTPDQKLLLIMLTGPGGKKLEPGNFSLEDFQAMVQDSTQGTIHILGDDGSKTISTMAGWSGPENSDFGMGFRLQDSVTSYQLIWPGNDPINIFPTE